MLTATLENVLNRGLPRSPRAQQLCAELKGRTLAVAISPLPGKSVLVESTGAALSVRVVRPDSIRADATVSGGPLSLLALSGPAPQTVVQRGDVRIEGDAELAEKFRELASLLKPDLEDELSLVLGDVPAHQIGRFARAAAAWSRKAAATSVRNAAEYLGHESRDVVPRSEAEHFFRGVDSLREDVDRLAARIEHLTRT
jgi:ubiquinone biosynthesis protein UbiJ